MPILRKIGFRSDKDKRSFIQKVCRDKGDKPAGKSRAKKNGQRFKMELLIEEIISHRKIRNDVEYLVRANCDNLHLWIPEPYVASSEALALYYESQKAKRRKISTNHN